MRAPSARDLRKRARAILDALARQGRLVEQPEDVEHVVRHLRRRDSIDQARLLDTLRDDGPATEGNPE